MTHPVSPRVGRGAGATNNKSVRQRAIRGQRGRRAALMRINVWIVLVVLIALLAVTRLLRYQQDTQRICADDPSASVCAGELYASRIGASLLRAQIKS